MSTEIADTEKIAGRTPFGQGSPPSDDPVVGRPPMRPKAWWVAGVLGLALPVAAYLWFLQDLAVNVPYQDGWSDVGILQSLYGGTLSLGDLWASHGDHRILFPNLIMLAAAQISHFNIVFEEYLSAAILFATLGLIIFAHRRRARGVPLLFYCPLVVLLLSFVQFQSTLWSFQLAWFLIILALAGVIVVLDRPTVGWGLLALAAAFAVVGSYSSLQGLLIWPAGLLLLWQRRRPTPELMAWAATGVVTTVVYFYHLHSYDYSDQSYLFGHPLASLKFFLFTVGSVVGVQLTNSPWPIIALGTAIVLLAIWVLVVFGLRRDETGGGPIGVALVSFGVLFALLITEGRAWYGLWAPSRYSTSGLLILAGCYLALLDHRRRSSTRRGVDHAEPVSASDTINHSWHQRAGSVQRRLDRSPFVGAAWVLLAIAIVLQVTVGNVNGLASARAWSSANQQVADVTANTGGASNVLVRHLVAKAGDGRALVRTLQQHRLSLFATGLADHYRRVGLFPQLTEVRTHLAVPTDGATIMGTRTLDAVATDQSGIVKVEFLLSRSGGGHPLVIGTGTLTGYGWVTLWNSTSVPDGTYRLRSVATGAGGISSTSPIVSVKVDNS